MPGVQVDLMVVTFLFIKHVFLLGRARNVNYFIVGLISTSEFWRKPFGSFCSCGNLLRGNVEICSIMINHGFKMVESAT